MHVPCDCGQAAPSLKGRLKGVLRIPSVTRDAPANREHHRPVAPQQGLKRRFIAAGQVMLQKLAVRQGGGAAQMRPCAEAAEQIVDGVAWQDISPSGPEVL